MKTVNLGLTVQPDGSSAFWSVLSSFLVFFLFFSGPFSWFLPLLGNSKCVRVTLSSLYIYAWEKRGLVNLISFRDFLKVF